MKKQSQKEVKLYGGLDNKTKRPTGYGDELAVTPDQAMTGTISEKEEGYMGDVIKHDKKFFSPKTKKLYSDAPYMEDLSGTTADIAVPESGMVAGTKNKKTTWGAAYGFSPLSEGIDKMSPEKAIEFKARPDYPQMKAEFEAINREFGLDVNSKEDIVTQLSRKNPIYQKEFIAKADEFCAKYGLSLKGLGLEEDTRIRGDWEGIELVDANWDFSETGTVMFLNYDETRLLFKVPVTEFQLVAQGKQTHVIDEEGEAHLCDKELAIEILDSDSENHKDIEEDYDYAGEEVNYHNSKDFNQLRQDIITDYELIIDSGIDRDTAIGSVAVKYRQDPGYVKALVENQIKKLKKEVMTEKEIQVKKLLESYGIITKSKAPIAEDDDEESEKDEDGDKDEDDSEDKEKKSKGPKKGVNPFAKKKDDDESEEEESEDDEEEKEESPEEEEAEHETHEFSGAGSSVDIKGMDRETAKGLAVKLLAPLEGTVEAPKGKYTITFEPEEEDLDEYAEIQPSHIPGAHPAPEEKKSRFGEAQKKK